MLSDFEIFLTAVFSTNFPTNPCHISHHTLIVSLNEKELKISYHIHQGSERPSKSDRKAKIP